MPLSSGGDRRRACRYSVALPECCLAWKKDSCLVGKACQVVDISMAGCLVESGSLPARMEKQPVWLRIPDLTPGDWTEGVIVSAWKPWFRKSRIRIKFVSPLPYDTFGAWFSARTIYANLWIANCPSTTGITSGVEIHAFVAVGSGGQSGFCMWLSQRF